MISTQTTYSSLKLWKITWQCEMTLGFSTQGEKGYEIGSVDKTEQHYTVEHFNIYLSGTKANIVLLWVPDGLW